MADVPFAANPIAAVSNMLGLTSYIGPYLRAVDLGLAQVGALINAPVVGTFLFWFLFGFLRWRRPVLVFVVIVVPFCIAMQFTAQRGYDALEQRFHEKGELKLEEDAHSKSQFFIRSSQTPDRNTPTLLEHAERIKIITHFL